MARLKPRPTNPQAVGERVARRWNLERRGKPRLVKAEASFRTPRWPGRLIAAGRNWYLGGQACGAATSVETFNQSMPALSR